MNDINQSEQSFIAHTIIVAHIYNIPYIMSLTNHSAHILNKIELTNCALRVERGVIIKRTMVVRSGGVSRRCRFSDHTAITLTNGMTPAMPTAASVKPS